MRRSGGKKKKGGNEADVCWLVKNKVRLCGFGFCSL